MTSAIVFSKNRAAQLDLLLRSIDANAPRLFDDVTVIWTGDDLYANGYRVCQDEHLDVVLLREVDLRKDTLHLVEHASDHVAFLMDDCVFYRPISGLPDPFAVLEDEDVLCFSPRLGLNTTYCYPLRRPQQVPVSGAAEDGCLYWEWATADADFSYGFSLDGHIFRRDDLLPLLRDVYDWATPNTVEAQLASMAARVERPLMAAHARSSLVGIPANRTSDTHAANRSGESHPYGTFELNSAYLAGRRIRLNSVQLHLVNAAHVEFPLRLA